MPIKNFDDDLGARVDKRISPDDAMYHGNLDHYLECGESALRILLSSIELAGVAPPNRILDFGAGAGRVTRWLKAAFPNAQIDACDLREQDMTFLRTAFEVNAWPVDPNPRGLEVPDGYDLIWAGSVITHLSEVNTKLLARKLLSACNQDGLTVLSFHGQYVVDRHKTGFEYIHETAWRVIETGYLTMGYGYADYEGQPDYGISVCSANRMVDLVRDIDIETRIILLGEQIWDHHHDVVAIQRRSAPDQSS